MIVKYCDRCGDGDENKTAWVTNVEWREDRGNLLGQDLCKRCVESLVDFFKPMPRADPRPKENRL